MELLKKVGNEVLKKGDVVKSPSGDHEWVVIDNEGDKAIIASISKMMHKDRDDLIDWYRVR